MQHRIFQVRHCFGFYLYVCKLYKKLGNGLKIVEENVSYSNIRIQISYINNEKSNIYNRLWAQERFVQFKVKEKSKLCSIAMDLAKHVTKLSGATDWPIWKRKIRDLIDYHDRALDALDGKIAKPELLQEFATAAQEKKHKEQSDFFRKANSYAKSMITTAVTDSIYRKIMDKETAHDTWEALKNQFEATAKDQVFRIANKFFAFSWNPGNDVSTHIARLRSLWNDLNQALKA